jgi:hypothetical protein
MAARGEKDVSSGRGAEREHAEPSAQGVPHRLGQARQADAAAQ